MELSVIIRVRRNGVSFLVNVTGDYTPAYPGCYYRQNGDPGNPPEPSDFEISSVLPVYGHRPKEEELVLSEEECTRARRSADIRYDEMRYDDETSRDNEDDDSSLDLE